MVLDRVTTNIPRTKKKRRLTVIALATIAVGVILVALLRSQIWRSRVSRKLSINSPDVGAGSISTVLATISGRNASERIEVRSFEELDAALLQIEGSIDPDVPALVTVTRRDGEELGVGLGGSLCVLIFTAKDLEPPYFISLGVESAQGFVDFFLQGHHTEIARKNLISREDAFEAVRRFVRTNRLPLPDNVQWEEV